MKLSVLITVATVVGGMYVGNVLADAEDSVVRGGRLYDHWGREAKERAPLAVHPAFPAGASNDAAADSWRCKECHGWDYNGKHGVVGIQKRKGANPSAIVAVLKDATHQYGGVLRDKELLDLANFVSRGQLDTPAIVGASKNLKPTAHAYEKFYATLCVNCHGSDGGKLREIPPLGDAARQRPLEVAHVIINGHPGGVMPAISALGTDLAAQLLAYLQTLPSLNLTESIAHGGRLYDNWQREEQQPPQALPHPAYPPRGYFVTDAPQTWRCKECHGWDYRGVQGDYASGKHTTGIKGIAGMRNSDPKKVLAVLRNAQHQYSAVLKERDLQDLVNFVSTGQIDMEPLINRNSRQAQGDASRGAPYYRTLCAGCHGIDGHHTGVVSLGPVSRTNPWGSLHTIINGHPGEKMPALREFDMQLLIDILAYVQRLPESR
jgi:mono/diheme cytochrome c family protein/rubredoxin